MKKVIGVTGGVGAGKSRVLNFLRDAYGACVITADKVAAELEEEGRAAYELLIDAFGDDILDSEGKLDRRAFSDLIFSDPAALEKVNDIVHPLTIAEIASRIDNSDAPLIVVEAAIFPGELARLCDEIWFIDTDDEVRISRLMSDRGYSHEKCEDIMKSQASREEFLSICDRVIDNSHSPEDTQDQIIRLLGSPDDKRKREML